MEVAERIPGVYFENLQHGIHPNFWTPNYHLQNVTLCQTPAHPTGYLAVVLFSSCNRQGLAAFTAEGQEQEQWIQLKNHEGLHYLYRYMDTTVHMGMVVAVTKSGKMCSWEMEGRADAEPAILASPDRDINWYYTNHVCYLTRSSGGDFQLVFMKGDHSDVDIKDGR